MYVRKIRKRNGTTIHQKFVRLNSKLEAEHLEIYRMFGLSGVSFCYLVGKLHLLYWFSLSLATYWQNILAYGMADIDFSENQ